MKENSQHMSPLKQALISIESMRRKIADLEAGRQEPAAVIGVGCRFHDCNNKSEFWNLLVNGREGIGEIPKSRWDVNEFYDADFSSPGKMNIRRGGFLKDVDKFDPQFFNISPREAERMDPQQRVLLEVIWEMFENSGILPERIKSSNTGVFVGIGSIDYSQYSYGNFSGANSYTGIGNASSIAANRISYFYDLTGPSIALDTACSSGLVAVHLALKSLQLHESNMAIAAGVNLILSPEAHLSFSMAQMMASDGRCKTFDAAADGYVRSEGCASILLKRLTDAEKDGDNILAVIRGSAVNQDGRSNGITAPNKVSQIRVIKAAHKDAGIDPKEIGYIESHGTGTKLGDPIEVQALSEVFKEVAAENKIILGAVKSNIGHTEIAAGLAGVIKVILSLENEVIPKNLNFDSINPLIPIDRIPFRLPTENFPWPKGNKPRIAGISSFGFGGTNAHCIVEEPPKKEIIDNAKYIPSNILAVSAKSQESLTNYLILHRNTLESNSDICLNDYCYSVNKGRSKFEFRKAFTGADTKELLEKLTESITQENKGSEEISEPSDELKIAFLLTGQGSQYVNMAKDLYLSSPVFKEEFDKCNKIISNYSDLHLKDIIYHLSPDDHQINETECTQPALFVIEYCLAKLWQSWGIQPDYLLGHSIGEYVAAALADVFSLEDALFLVLNRGRMMQGLPKNGSMAVIFAEFEKVKKVIDENEEKISIAAANGPLNTVISGEKNSIDTIIDKFKDLGFKTHKLNVSHAFHSNLMDPILDEFEKIAANIDYKFPQIPIISNVTGKLFENNAIPDSKYWRDHIRNTVHFSSGLAELEKLGVNVFIEIGPKPILLTMGQAQLTKADSLWLPSLNFGKSDWEILLNSLAKLFEYGHDVNWDGFYNKYLYKYVSTPTYPFNRSRFWMENAAKVSSSSGDNRIPEDSIAHPLLGKKISSPVLHGKIIETLIDPKRISIIRDHIIFGMTLFPVMAYSEMILAGARLLFKDTTLELYDLELLGGIRFEENKSKIVQTVFESSNDSISAKVFSTDEDSEQNGPIWELNASCKVIPIRKPDNITSPKLDLDEIKAKCKKFSDAELELFYRSMLLTGFEHGKSMHVISDLWYSEKEALGRFELDGSLAEESGEYLVHPSITDSGTQLFAAILKDNPEYQSSMGIFLPVSIAKFNVLKSGAEKAWGHVTLSDISKENGSLISDLKIISDEGELIAEIIGIKYKYTPFSRFIDLFNLQIKNWYYDTEWIEYNGSDTKSQSTGRNNWLIIGNTSQVSNNIHSRIIQNGEESVLVKSGAEFRIINDQEIEINPYSSSDYEMLFRTLKEKKDFSLNRIIYASAFDYFFNDIKEHQYLYEIHKNLFKKLILFVQSLIKTEFSVPPKVWIVSKSSYSIENDKVEINLAQTPMNGFFNSLDHEVPEFKFTRVDLAENDNDKNIEHLFEEIYIQDQERQISYRNNKRYLGRLAHISSRDFGIHSRQPKYLHIDEKGILDNLKFVPAKRSRPDREMVEIEVRATGLNFRDVLNALDLYPGDAGLLGGECSGIITAVGEEVETFKVGDEVLGIASGSFGTYVHTHHNLLVKKPNHLSFEEAATIPIPFLTAYYSLHSLAKIKNGDTVLIHAASGGVGLAAIQIAKIYGARIFGTASSEEKQAVLRSEGVELIMNSRTLDFEDEVKKYTEGRGVDIILNSFNGDYIESGLKIVAKEGTFLEIGKIDIWDDDLVNRFREDISYHRIAIDELSKHDKPLLKRLLEEIIQMFEKKILSPIRHNIYPLNDVKSAFKLMRSAKHIGKIVISQNDEASNDIDRDKIIIDKNSSYLITGGKGALGLLAANWLISRGAKNILLVSRKDPDAETKEIIEAYRKNNINITSHNIDIANYSELNDFFNNYFHNGRQNPELKGVIHAAGLLEDGFILQQNWEKFEKVLDPKIKGAWNLHLLTKEMNLDFMVYFSSVASIIGSPGQSNYSSANFFLDSLANYRKQKGLAALSINWGPWSHIGMASKVSHKQTDLIRGIGKISPAQGKYLLNEIIDQNHIQIGILPINWDEFKRNLNSFGNLPFLSEILRINDSEERADRIPVLIEKLNNSGINDHFEITRSYIKETVKRVLGIKDGNIISYNKPLSELGIDSLLGLEIKKNIDSAVGLNLPATLVFNYPTIDKITEYLLIDVLNKKESVDSRIKGKTTSSESGNKIIEDIKGLSDEEAEKILLNKLNTDEFDTLDDNE